MIDEDEKGLLEDVAAVMKALVAKELAPIRQRLDALEAKAANATPSEKRVDADEIAQKVVATLKAAPAVRGRRT